VDRLPRLRWKRGNSAVEAPHAPHSPWLREGRGLRAAAEVLGAALWHKNETEFSKRTNTWRFYGNMFDIARLYTYLNLYIVIIYNYIHGNIVRYILYIGIILEFSQQTWGANKSIAHILDPRCTRCRIRSSSWRLNGPRIWWWPWKIPGWTSKWSATQTWGGSMEVTPIAGWFRMEDPI